MPQILDLHVNLNNGALSAKHTSGPRYGRLLCHAQTAVIRDAVFRVQAGGHARAVRTGVRNVHAFVRGEAELDADVSAHLAPGDLVRIRYSPFKGDKFYEAESGRPVISATLVVLDGHRMYARNPQPADS